MTSELPLVSIGIPCYRAAEFVENIAANITETEYGNLEFLISDRHGYDDAIECLRARFRDDARVKFYSASDQLGWEGNFNFVLKQASGKYFRWLSQDDRLPVDGLQRLVDTLESKPDAVLAYGLVDVINREGEIIYTGQSRYRREPTKWNFLQALFVFGLLRYSAASHGLFVRRVVVDSNLFIKAFPGGLSTRAWRFALALRGRFCFVPEFRSQYRVHAAMFRVSNPMKLRYFYRYTTMGCSYVQDFDPSIKYLLPRLPGVLACGLIVAPMVTFGVSRVLKIWVRYKRQALRTATESIIASTKSRP